MTIDTIERGVGQALYALENAIDDLSGYYHGKEGREYLMQNYPALSRATLTLIRIIAKLDPDALHFEDRK